MFPDKTIGSSMNHHYDTTVERFIDERARKILLNTRSTGFRSGLVECVVFVLKQAWACAFGGALLILMLATRIWYPDDAWLAKNDFLTIAAVAIQIIMVSTRLETLKELRVIILFHVVGTVMEVFKTGTGSWSYEEGGVLHFGAVPLFSGFMYAAVGSYLVRVYRLFGLRFSRYPPQWLTVVLAVAIYANFFTDHYGIDVRWFLVLAVGLIFGPCMMHFHFFRRRFRMPLVLAFTLVALFIWFAENVGTRTQTWTYPDQVAGWHPVSIEKLVSWLLLMIISVVLVTWVYPPKPPDSSVLTPAGSKDGSGQG